MDRNKFSIGQNVVVHVVLWQFPRRATTNEVCLIQRTAHILQEMRSMPGGDSESMSGY